MKTETLFHSNSPLPVCEPLVRRERCFRLLDQSFVRPLVCISGAQGYGKSVLVLSYAEARQIPTVWMHLEPGKEQLPVFLDTVSKGLSAFARDDINSEEIHLLDSLTAWQQRLMIVLDCGKYTELDRPLMDYLLQLVQHSSRSVTFVAIGRSRPKLPYVKLKAQGHAAEFKTEDLRFQAEEISAFFQMLGFNLEENESRGLFLHTGGWAFCLPYLAEAWSGVAKSGRNYAHPLLDELLDEVLSGEQDPRVSGGLEDLQQLSVLHELKAEMNGFLPERLSEEKWEPLAANCFFLQRNEDFSYRMLPLVRHYLYRRLLRVRGKEAVNALHLRAADLYESQYQYYYAFAHSLAAGHYTEAARLMQVMMNFYTPERFLLLLDGTLEAICPSISISTFSMFLFRCVPIPVLQSFVPGLEEAMRRLDQDGLSAAQVYLRHRLGLIYFYIGEVGQARSLFVGSLASSERLGNHEFAIINLSLLAQCCRFMGELAEGIVYARRALSEIESIGSYDAHMHTVWILTELLLEQGELSLAGPIISELLKLAEQYHDEAARIYPLLSKAKFCRLKGDLKGALQLAEISLSRAEKYRIDPDLGWICLELGLIHQSRSESDSAIRFFERSAEYFKHYAYFRELVRRYIDAGTASETTIDTLGTAAAPDPDSGRSSDRQEAGAVSIQGAAKDGDDVETLSIRLLGPLHIQCGGQELRLQRKSSLQLLIHLAVHYHKKLPKEQLLEELFPDSDYVSQNNRFYVSLSALRKNLEPNLKSGRQSAYILQSGEFFYLNLDRCSLDLTAFDSLVGLREEPSGQRMEHLLQAEKLYIGDLLEEYPYEAFLEPVRERTKQAYLQLLREIGLMYWSRKDFRLGIQYFERILEKDSFAESAYWEYIRILLEQGFLQNARQIAGKMLKNLEQELGVPVKERLLSQFPQLIL